MEHVVDRPVDLERPRHVVAEELEIAAPQQVGDVLPAPGHQVVDADHLVALGDQPLAEVRAEEAGPAGDHGTAHARTRRGRAGSPTAARAGNAFGRPIETYSKPAAAIFSGS